MTTTLEKLQPEPEEMLARARADLQARIDAAHVACGQAMREGNQAEADRQWTLLIGLLEVQMGRTSSAERLTMTQAVPATR